MGGGEGGRVQFVPLEGKANRICQRTGCGVERNRRRERPRVSARAWKEGGLLTGTGRAVVQGRGRGEFRGGSLLEKQTVALADRALKSDGTPGRAWGPAVSSFLPAAA